MYYAISHNEEPAMDQRDEFSKWMASVEQALSEETTTVDEELLEQGSCGGCGSWECPECFPETEDGAGSQQIPAMIVIGGTAPDSSMSAQQGVGMAGAKPVECPTCGHSHEDADSHADELDMSMMPEDGIEDVDMSFDEDNAATPVDKTPRSGRGVKLGHIVQQYKPIDDTDGEDSPLTYGDDLEEAEWDGLDDEPDFDISEPDYDADPLAVKQSYQDMEYLDPEEAMGMIGAILNMQSQGMSNANQEYTEEQLSRMNASQLKSAHSAVTGAVAEDEMMPDMDTDIQAATGGTLGAGQGGQYAPGTAPTMPESIQTKEKTMENVDKDVAAMMNSLKKYDKLNESVLGMTNVGFAGGAKNNIKEAGPDKKDIPAFLRKEKGGDWKTTKADLEKEKDSRISDPKTLAKNTGKKVDEAATADADTLEWMSRLAKLGNMKGYGR